MKIPIPWPIRRGRATWLVGGGATADEKCAGDLESTPDFGIDVDDIDGFARRVVDGGC